MRLVLDTNVLIAAFIAHGNCSELLEHCIVHHDVVLPQDILDELLDVLVRKFKFSKAEAQAATHLIQTRVTLVDPVPLAAPVCRDADDDVILATAKAGRCAAIITGDKDLTDLRQIGPIKILSPSDFWKFENESGEQEKR